MKFPRSFECMGNTIKIRYTKKMKDLGLFYPDKGLIKILKTPEMSDDQIWTTVCHECCHAFMYNMNLINLYNDEQFIDILANLILQWKKNFKIII